MANLKEHFQIYKRSLFHFRAHLIDAPKITNFFYYLFRHLGKIGHEQKLVLE